MEERIIIENSCDTCRSISRRTNIHFRFIAGAGGGGRGLVGGGRGLSLIWINHSHRIIYTYFPTVQRDISSHPAPGHPADGHPAHGHDLDDQDLVIQHLVIQDLVIQHLVIYKI